MTEADNNRSPRVRNLIAFSALIMLLLCEVVTYQALQAYHVAKDEAKVNAARLTRIMSQQIELSFLSVDSTLHRAVEHQYYNDLFGGNLPDYMLRNMQLWVDESPRIAAMILIDAAGNPVIAAHKKEYTSWLDYTHHSFAEDALFSRLKAGSDTDYFLGTFSRGDDPQGLLLMGRKITRVDGSFGGVFLAVIDPHFFIEYFMSVDQGTKSYLSLQLLDGTLLVDGPPKSPALRDLDARVISQLKTSHLRNTSVADAHAIDKNLAIYAYEALKDLPVAIMVALDEEDYLKPWRQACLKDIGFLAIFTVFGSVLSFFALTMARQIVRVEESEAAAVLAYQSQSEFLANISHELRTPLNAIIGFSEMMNSGYFGPLNPKQKERIHDINLCGSHLLHLINDILEFSKGSAGKLELVEENVAMNEIVSEVTSIMNEKIKAKRMNMIIDVEEGLPLLFADKRKIRQILLNLVSNSLKFTPEEGTIKVAVRKDASGSITMTVSDTGIGIAEEDIPVALSVFGQVHRNHSQEGTGLGLPLCKMFAEMHGGRLAIGSTVGEGTTVRIIFPSSRNVFPGKADDKE